MKDTMMDFNGWSADEVSLYRSRRMGRDSDRLRVLLTIAAVLLAVALGLDDKVMTRLLGTDPDRMSTYEARHAEQVTSLLQQHQARRAEQADLNR
jgi:hypothetical protein